MVLPCEPVSESPGGSAKTQIAGPVPQFQQAKGGAWESACLTGAAALALLKRFLRKESTLFIKCVGCYCQLSEGLVCCKFVLGCGEGSVFPLWVSHFIVRQVVFLPTHRYLKVAATHSG